MTIKHCLLVGALLAATTAPVAAQSTLSGEQIYARCLACHTLAYDRVGPHHCGLLGRRAGSVPGFAYSTAMKNSGLIWDEKTLDRFLSHPMKVVPGTAMTYDGISDSKERSVLIAYLKHANDTPECRGLASTPR